MIWLFDRGGERLKYEICRHDDGNRFLLVKTRADGQEEIEEVDQPAALIEKSVNQMRQLKDDGWKIG